ncbi:hypothetical protein B566_EDAN003963 [Ephemera danica]|nr:hypothetical protein B566_EDAN003963 [Ephemera danica]
MGILDAMKNKERLLRSKSETNLKSPSIASQPDVVDCIGLGVPLHSSRLHVGPLTQLGPPDMWNLSPTSLSMEHLSVDGSSQDEQDSPDEEGSLPSSTCTTKAVSLSTPAGRRSTETELSASRGSPSHQHPESEARNYNLNVRMPCGNGQAYSVSQNKVVFLPSCQDSPSSSVSSVKLRVTALESQQALTGSCKPGVSLQVPDRKGLVLNLTSQFEAAGSKPGSPEESSTDPVLDEELTAMTQTKLAPQKLQAILVKKEIWDPAEHKSSLLSTSPSSTSIPSRADVESLLSMCASDPQWASTLTSHILSDAKPSSPTPVPKVNDPFSAQLDRVFDREERRQQRLSTSMPVEVSSSNTSVAPQDKLLAATLSSSMETALPTALRDCPSRQSSWSSYDSAVVLGYQGEPREAPSRQSSWGSADTRWTYGTLPSRNSSWGSYDIRPNVGYNNVTERDEKTQQNDDLESLLSNSSSGMFSYDREAWYPGTVKRTKQKLEAESNTIKRVCSDSGVPMSHSSPPSSESSCDITSSSPPVISTATLRLQGPRPYQNPATVGPIVTPVQPEQQQTTASGQPLVHYASSPTLCHKRLDEEMLSASVPEKMAISQPNISSYLSHSDAVRQQQQTKSKLSELETNPLLVNILQCPPGKKVLEELVSKMQPNNGEVLLPDLLQSTSAPSVAKAVKQESGATWLSEEVSQPSTTPGVVKSLKKEFEAKSVRKEKATSVIVETSVIKEGDSSSPELRVKCGSDKVKSLPSSPVSTTCPPQSISTSGTPVEDLTVKRLVDKFEVNHNGDQPAFLRSISDSPPVGRPRFLSENNSSSTKRKSSPAGLALQPPVPPRKSSFEVTAASGANILARNARNGTENRINRLPPTTQPVLLGLAKPKKQQGKTHPLARLTFNKPRHNNPVYNTM